MIFESMWPLALLLCVPVVILLYLLKPKGKDYRISSNLLWQKLFKNQQSKTFIEKFVQNILMYVQILILMLLILALMSPYINRKGVNHEQVVVVLDASGSMRLDAGNGKSRFDVAKDEIRSLIATAEDSNFSLLMNDCNGTSMLAIAATDKQVLYQALREAVCSDGEADWSDANSMVETLRGGEEEASNQRDAQIMVFTDGSGTKDVNAAFEQSEIQLYVMGKAVSNVSNNFLSYSFEEELTACAGSLTNYSDLPAGLEISLYDGEVLKEVKAVNLKAGETRLILFTPFEWDKKPLKTELSQIRFDGEETQSKSAEDALNKDNLAYAVFEKEAQTDALLLGNGNTYIEKAYLAATGQNLKKMTEVSDEDAALLLEENIVIYDASKKTQETYSLGKNQFIFGGNQNKLGEKEHAVLSFSASELTTGLEQAVVGVNKTNTFTLPEQAVGFLWAGEECAGYYEEKNGQKCVVLGFDIRESNFPVKAEFPVFMSNALRFLGDSSLMAKHYYEAGENLLFHPQSDFDVSTIESNTNNAGIFTATAGERSEDYVVRFATASESDGRIEAESLTSESTFSEQLVKKRLRTLFIILALLFMVVEWLIYLYQMRYKGKFYYVIRAIGVVALFLALFGVAVNKKDAANTTVFLVDISNSNAQNLKEMEQYVKQSLEQMPKKNQYGIVTFGRNSLVEQFLTDDNNFVEIMSLPDKSATSFEEAVSKALTMIPANGAGRIVVLTDGKETRGDISRCASALTTREIEFLAKSYESSVGKDVYLEQVELPSYLYKGDAYSMTVSVASNYETEAQLEVWENDEIADVYDVFLNKGMNSFRFKRLVENEKAENFEVRVVAKDDSCEENNSYHAYALVDSVPKVLLVTGLGENSNNYKVLLDSAGCNYTEVRADMAPDNLGKLLEYKSVILDNVYLSDLPKGFLESIDTYVKDYGCGLICCGGEQSYALGGYRDSIMETILPVDMDLKGVNEIPSMAMVMVIDHSGSMCSPAGDGSNATNLDLAITAAKTAVDQLRSDDYVGVVTFDDSFQWVVKPTQVTDKEEIKRKIETITDGGGTTIKPALGAAYGGIMDCDVSVRHVVLLTDGQGETTNYNDIISKYNKGQVTMSTVAVGSGADTQLMEKLANSCKGRYYYSEITTDIPMIFAQEVYLGGDTFIQNGEFALSVNTNHELTNGLFEQGWPLIYGYVCSSAKPHASQLIASERDDPILTTMQYGLGHTVAWNTDVDNKWTAPFAKEADYVQLWKRIIDYSAGNMNLGADSVDVLTADGATVVSYKAKDYGENTAVEAVYTDPTGQTHTVPLKVVSPGRYEGKLETDQSGVYHLRVHRKDEEAITNAMTTAALVQYSDEYKFDVNAAKFNQFVEQYGRQLKDEENFWKQRKSQSKKRYELTVWLLLFALLWFLLDIALRRLCYEPKESKWFKKLRTKKEKPLVSEVAMPLINEPAVEEEAFTPVTEEKKKTKVKKEKEKKKEQEEQTLDTSALLQKRDRRR